jgi:mono/diheme cytochrome c family protein
VNYISQSVLAFFVILFLPSQGFAAGMASAGEDLAVQLCASCHVVTEDQKTALADAPTFQSIAVKYGKEIDFLGGFLSDPHPPMPNFNLSRQEIQDLLAFIKSLN